MTNKHGPENCFSGDRLNKYDSNITHNKQVVNNVAEGVNGNMFVAGLKKLEWEIYEIVNGSATLTFSIKNKKIIAYSTARRQQVITGAKNE